MHQLILDTVTERYGRPAFVFFFGSHAFGRGDAASDVDVIVVMEKVQHAYRENFCVDGFLFDAYVHDAETLHFVLRSEYENGLVIMAGKIDQAVVLPQPCELASVLKELARQVLQSHPPKPNWDTPRRYLTAFLSDLERCTDPAEQRMIAMDLYVKTLDLFLRSHGHFTGQGRYLIRAAKKLDPVFYDRAHAGLEEVFRHGSVASLIDVARDVLDRIGGPLDAGYRLNYPPKFRLGFTAHTGTP